MRPRGPVPWLMIAAKLAQRRLVQLKQKLAQLLGFRITGCETLSVLTQHADEGVSVLVADFVVLVAVAIVETGLMLLSMVPKERHLPAAERWQLRRSRRGFSLVRQQPVPEDQGRLPRRGRAGCQPPGGWRLHHQASG